MTEEKKFDAEWSIATLSDAKEALEDLIAQIEGNPEEVEEILTEGITNVYAKLNYAYHSAEYGPETLLMLPDDELVAFPNLLPLKSSLDFED